ncbi:MAG: restriction endonuclease subunit R [Leptolyngbyaceae cyanobacterium RM2_2_4]|nr:restriction endonuclease subunit R [Leptolyngbyaceae cyanobacterium SM1_4_3]NJN90195.1 restriction endonuclease subunit R [Leptolyngbyaceae cyanobacterium SL_5_14]NJO48535.1 restriction endonuclease subunit R [Leptolyngbyaceae cyanobacterium RM2_2_4]NJO73200.1 restriction endonuclease subunit R [Leptolyngbyaceae cyanobacterium RM1_406_9]
MVQSLPISNLSLYDVEAKFDLKEVHDEAFFSEWYQHLPELTESERQDLDQIKRNFLYLNESPLAEVAVKMVVLSPLLSMAGFYQPPFRFSTEASVQIVAEDDGQLFRGRIDVLVLQERFWILTVESKEAGFSLKQAIAQALAYMMGTPYPERPAFGLVTNGSEFRFIKLEQHDVPQYGFSDLFTLQRRQNELYSVLQIIKHLGQTSIL